MQQALLGAGDGADCSRRGSWMLCPLLCAAVGTVPGLRQMGLSDSKVSEGLAEVLSYQRRNGVLSKQVCKTMDLNCCVVI